MAVWSREGARSSGFNVSIVSPGERKRLGVAGVGAGQEIVNARRDAGAHIRNPKGSKQSGEDVHSVVGAEDEDRQNFKDDDQEGKRRKPFFVEAGEFDGPLIKWPPIESLTR